jgi:glycine cleavage system transcriptional repressor
MADHLIAVTVLGPDRKGLLAEVTGALIPLSVYHQDDARISFLPGGNVSILMCVHTDVSVHRVREALDEVPHQGGLLIRADELADVTSVHQDPSEGVYVLRVRTIGRPGVMTEFTKIVARHGGLILDFGTRIGGGRISVVRIELEEHSVEAVEALRHDLYHAAEIMGIGIKFYDAAIGENDPVESYLG